MKKSDIQTPITYFNRYIDLVDDMDIHQALALSLRELDQLDLEKLLRIGDRTYAADKWTIKQIIQHICDWERIMGYRALVFARRAAEAPLPGHDENGMAHAARVDHRSLQDVLAEMRSVRVATIALFEGMDAEALGQAGMANTAELSALALGFTIVGHQKHHFNIIAERYWPLGG
jgi:hypothetical protein